MGAQLFLPHAWDRLLLRSPRGDRAQSRFRAEVTLLRCTARSLRPSLVHARLSWSSNAGGIVSGQRSAPPRQVGEQVWREKRPFPLAAQVSRRAMLPRAAGCSGARPVLRESAKVKGPGLGRWPPLPAAALPKRPPVGQADKCSTRRELTGAAVRTAPPSRARARGTKFRASTPPLRAAASRCVRFTRLVSGGQGELRFHQLCSAYLSGLSVLTVLVVVLKPE